MNGYGRYVGVAGTVVLAAVAVGCASRQPSTRASSSVSTAVSAPSSSVVANAAGCTASNVPMTTLVPKANGEPTLGLPTPSGWVYSSEMNSPLIRGLVANVGLRANNFTPNAVVTLEDLTGKVSNAQQGIDAELAGATKSGLSIESRTPGTVCGQQSTTVTYALQGHAATGLIVVATDGQKVWAATLTVQTSEPDNPTYIADSRTILNNFRIILASAAP